MRALFTFLAVTLLSVAASAQFQFTIVAGDVITIDAVSPGGTCTYGGFSVEHDPLIGSTTSDHWCFPGNTGPAGQDGQDGQDGQTGATGAQGPAGTGFHYLDSSDTVVPDVYFREGSAVYWTGAAFWPVSERYGTDDLDYGGAPLLLRYLTSSCNTTPIEQNDHQNLVAVARPTSGTVGAYRPGDAVTYTGQGTCYGWTSGNACAAMGCPPQPWVQYVSAGTAPDVSSYDMPMRPVGN